MANVDVLKGVDSRTFNLIHYEMILKWMKDFDKRYDVSTEVEKAMKRKFIDFNLPDDQERILTCAAYYTNMEVTLKLQSYLSELGDSLSRLFSNPFDYTTYEVVLPCGGKISYNKNINGSHRRDDIGVFLRSFDNPIKTYVNILRTAILECRDELKERGYVRYVEITDDIKAEELIHDPLRLLDSEQYYKGLFL